MHESQKVASNLFMIKTSEAYLLLLSDWDKLTVIEGHCMY